MKKHGNPFVQFFSCFLRPKKKTPRSRVAPEFKETDLHIIPTNIDEEKSDAEYIAEKSPNPIHSTSSIEEILTIDEFVETAAAISKCVSTCLEHRYLLPQHIGGIGKPCLILDLDETLVHSSFKKPSLAFDFTVEMKVSPYRVELVYVAKRPGVDTFLQQLSLYYELYANPVIDQLDPTHTLVSHRLFRDSCVFYRGYYIKNLESLGRSLTETIIVDNSPFSYLLQPSNAVAIPSWYSDPEDIYLLHILKPLVDISKLDNPVNALHLVNSLILNPLPYT